MHDLAFGPGLAAAEAWAEVHGHLLAPVTAVSEGGFPVGIWLKNQRAAARQAAAAALAHEQGEPVPRGGGHPAPKSYRRPAPPQLGRRHGVLSPHACDGRTALPGLGPASFTQPALAHRVQQFGVPVRALSPAANGADRSPQTRPEKRAA
ncbi:helicase associated domain-containing protein [Streptomyces sp. CB01635]|uniref:helicase associated domain-containing protein n=1 Tax=unclassified Streptomyces TaxID=2593676 RepID=UPI002278ADEC|nr:helicase associated domain-containing protein [Streptomyces sp. CB01635]